MVAASTHVADGEQPRTLCLSLQLEADDARDCAAADDDDKCNEEKADVGGFSAAEDLLEEAGGGLHEEEATDGEG